MPALCASLNVIEVGDGAIGASLAGMAFADAGARVIKIEPPGGDQLRSANPNGFLIWNRGKESKVIDLATTAGQAEFRALAAAADVIIEEMPRGAAKAFQIDAATLRALNPALVHCAITAFGDVGPYTHIKARDALVAAKLGLWNRGPFASRSGPELFPVPWGSFGAAMLAIAGAMAALIVREDTGAGQSVHATMASGLEPLDYFMSIVAQVADKRAKAGGGGGQSVQPPSRNMVLLATRDGRLIQTSVMLLHQARAVTEVAGLKDALSDPRFEAMPRFKTVDDAQAWEDLLVEAFREHDLDYWLPRLEANADIAFEVARTSEEGTHHPQIVHNGDVITIDDPVHGPVRQIGPLGHFLDTPMKPSRSAPALDANAGPLLEGPKPKAGGPDPAYPLAGFTIVESGVFYAMPFGLAMAAALGARVIKLEDKNGDPHRMAFGPDVASAKTIAGKECVSLDLKAPEGQKIAHDIIARADVFVTGLRPSVQARLGLDHETLTALNPGLVYMQASGYGSDGPYAHRALYAPAASAVAGSFGRQVGYWSDPARSVGMSALEVQAIVFPRLKQVIDGDSNAALAVLAALCLALYDRKRTGKGQRLVTSMIGSNALVYADDFCEFRGKQPVPRCDEDAYGVHALERLYECADGSWLCLALRCDDEFRRLATTLGRQDLGGDAKFADDARRKANDTELVAALSAALASRPALEWEDLLCRSDVGAAAVSAMGLAEMVAYDEGLVQSGLTVTTEHPLFGQMRRWAPPVSFSDLPCRVAPPVVRGNDNHAVLTELGYGQAEIAAFEARGVLFPPDKR